MKNKKWKVDPISLFSHELKTPLSSLKLGMELLERDFEKHRDMLPLMKGELERLIDFITDNLDLRFIQEKKDLFQWEWREFEPLISQLCDSLNWMAKRERVSLHIKNRSGGPALEILTDVSWMSRLMENLLTNALHFAPENTGVFIEYGLNNEGGFFCSVKDEGPGLSDPEKVFDPFYKSSYSKENLKNTGLGLSIAKAIVEAHGGSISASSGGSKGAVFDFILPKARFSKKSA